MEADEAVNQGFSRKARVYDAHGAAHPAIGWARAQVYTRVESVLRPGGSILELNAGTGADAAHLARRGYRVHATDLADGMAAEITRKITAYDLADRLTAQRCSFTKLDRITGGPYDLILSNFGGLNCVPLSEVRSVAQGLPYLLKAGGHVVWVIMPPWCPWEWAQALRGRFRIAFRRLPRRTLAHVEGAHFPTYYFTPREIAAAFGPRFRQIHLESLSLFSPPAFMDRFPRRFPRLFHWLTSWDARVCHLAPFNQMGDFFMITLRYDA
jgi:SAM-dependent methyltransferase